MSDKREPEMVGTWWMMIIIMAVAMEMEKGAVGKHERAALIRDSKLWRNTFVYFLASKAIVWIASNTCYMSLVEYHMIDFYLE